MKKLIFESSYYDVQALSLGITKRLLVSSESSLFKSINQIERQGKRGTQQVNYSEEFMDDNENEEAQVSNYVKSSILNFPQYNIVSHYILARSISFIKDFDDKNKLNLCMKKKENLIPIKLNIDNLQTNHKIIDFFMWNLNEVFITPDQFSTIFCNDLDLPSSVHNQITESINQQISDYNFVSNLQFPLNDPYIVIIEFSVCLNKKLYQDKIEWDINQSDFTPEDFSHIVVSDLGLSLEFKPAIAHALHETIIKIKKEVCNGKFNILNNKIHHLNGLTIECGIRICAEGNFQSGKDQWEPIVESLTTFEIEKREIEKERNLRRLKRENMKRETDDFGLKKRYFVNKF